MRTRPVPTVQPETAPYWEAARAGRLLLPRCRTCGRAHHHPRPWCPHCWSQDLTWEEAAGTGEVVTFTVVHQPPSPAFETPYVLAVIELDDGPRMMANVVDVDPSAVRIGLRVAVTFEPRGEVALPQFRPLEERS